MAFGIEDVNTVASQQPTHGVVVQAITERLQKRCGHAGCKGCCSGGTAEAASRSTADPSREGIVGRC